MSVLPRGPFRPRSVYVVGWRSIERLFSMRARHEHVLLVVPIVGFPSRNDGVEFVSGRSGKVMQTTTTRCHADHGTDVLVPSRDLVCVIIAKLEVTDSVFAVLGAASYSHPCPVDAIGVEFLLGGFM